VGRRTRSVREEEFGVIKGPQKKGVPFAVVDDEKSPLEAERKRSRNRLEFRLGSLKKKRLLAAKMRVEGEARPYGGKKGAAAQHVEEQPLQAKMAVPLRGTREKERIRAGAPMKKEGGTEPTSEEGKRVLFGGKPSRSGTAPGDWWGGGKKGGQHVLFAGKQGPGSFCSKG